MHPEPVKDYSNLIDEETWRFIEKTNSFHPENTVEFSIAEQREVYDAMCAAFHGGRPEGVDVTDGVVMGPDRSIPIRNYTGSEKEPVAVVVYYHGGGFVVGGLESHDDVCAEICSRTGFDVISVDYSLSPESPFPACFDDALYIFRQIAASSKHPVVLAGDSAGGNLVAAVCEATKGDHNRPVGQVLIYPALGPKQETVSFHHHANAPMLTQADCRFYHEIRAAGEDYSDDPRNAPLAAKEFSGLPPSVIFSAEIDPLCDDGKIYAKTLKAAGIKAQWFCETGLPHGYLRARHTVNRASKSFDRIVEAIAMLGTKDWRY